MKRTNKKKFIIGILFLFLVLFFILVFKISKAEELKLITAEVIDYSGILDNEEVKIIAKNDGEAGYYIELPELINEKYVVNYFIDKKEINLESNNKTEELNTIENQNTILENPENVENNTDNSISENLIEENSITEFSDNTEKEQEVNVENKIDTEEIESNESNNENSELIGNGVTSNNENQSIENSNDVNKTISENEVESEKEKFKVTEKTVIKKANDKLYLTKSEMENLKISLVADYFKKETEDEVVLYNKEISCNIEDIDCEEKDNENIDELSDNELIKNIKKEQEKEKICISGYMPLDAKISAKKVDEQSIIDKTENELERNVNFLFAYDIKIISDGKEFEPTDFDENVVVAIKVLDGENKKYRVLHIGEENVEEVQKVEYDEKNRIKFEASSFSVYAVYEDESEAAATLLASEVSYLAAAAPPGSSQEEIDDSWDGTIATRFEFGSGSQNDPYLIIGPEELAYLAQRVNSGNGYEGRYFKLVTDIDLGENVWTPIGNNDYPFKGIFDGSGHVISNGVIETTNNANYSLYTYGLFGALGGGNSYAIIKNLELSDLKLDIKLSGNLENTGGLYAGILVGTMRNKSKVVNVIVKNSTIIDSNTSTLYTADFQLFVGGICGCASNTGNIYWDQDPGNGSRYSIENCFSNVNITLDVADRRSSMQYSGQYGIGGIIGGIKNQPVWPTNCLYTGNINATVAFIGPIFGYLRNYTGYTSTNSFNTLWNGNDAGNLTMNSYYSAYKANNINFTASQTNGNAPTNTTYRVKNNSNNIGYVQGVNKGIYTNNISSRLNSFNSYDTNNEYTDWEFRNGTYKFVRKLSAELNDSLAPLYTLNVSSTNSNPRYSYKWWVNGTYRSDLSTSIYQEQSLEDEYSIKILVSDGVEYEFIKYFIPRLEIHIVFNVDYSTHQATATLAGTALPYIDIDDYTYEWYILDVSGYGDTLLKEGDSNVLENLQEVNDYKLVATNSEIPALSAEATFTYGERTVIYVSQANGSDSNNGLTPETAVKTLTNAYSKINVNYDRTGNVIVLMGDYSNNDYLYGSGSTQQRNFSKKATVTGCYQQNDYGARLYFHTGTSTTTGRFLYEDTTLQYMTLYGSTSNSATGVTYLYCQGHSLTIGEEVYIERYATLINDSSLMDNVGAPNFHIMGGWLNAQTSLPSSNNGTIIIKSGCFCRVVAGNRNTQVNSTAKNTVGTVESPLKMKIVIDIQHSTKGSVKYDVNLLVAGVTNGNIYGNIEVNIKNGYVGRLTGGSIGYNRDISNFSSNTYYGSSKIIVDGGEIDELYGGSLGRYKYDIYYYGRIDIIINGGTINSSLYGVGAGGVTGYSEHSTDPYKRYGQPYETSVHINMTGGKIVGNLYGGGYGYTSYLSNSQIADDGGALYGDTYISISGGTIEGNVYGAGRGYSGYYGKTKLAQMYGSTNIIISGTPNIQGSVYGAGEGISGYADTAKLIGATNVYLNTDLNINVFGAGNIGQTQGATNVYINSNNQTGEIYGGGNVGIVDGYSNVYINKGNVATVYGGGKSANVLAGFVHVKGGNTNNIYAGSNTSGTVQYGSVISDSGVVENMYGGNNAGGTTITTDIYINDGTITNVFGGGNEAQTTLSNITTKGGTVANIYGGGNKAGITNSYIFLLGGDIGNTYGGSNQSGIVNSSHIENKKSEDLQPPDLPNVEELLGQHGLDMEISYRTESTNFLIQLFYGYSSIVDVTVTLTNGTNQDISNWGGSVKVSNGTLKSNDSNTPITESNGTFSFTQNDTNGNANVVPANGGTYSFTFSVYSSDSTSNVSVESELTNTGVTTTPAGHAGPGGGPVGPGGQTNPEPEDIYADLLVTVDEIYGGNNAGGTTDISNIKITKGNIGKIFGGNNAGGQTTISNVNIEGGNIEAVYGGNNVAGKTVTANVIIDGGEITDVFGGGDYAETDFVYVNVIGGRVTHSVYGGGNQAPINTSTNLILNGATVDNNVYGGGNFGIVTQNTNVRVTDSILGNSLYAGGNGNTAVVYGNTNLNMDGISNNIEKNVFGGGNKAPTGTDEDNNSLSSVNIVGGTIGGNVYGAANTSVIYGRANVKIGYDEVNNSDLTKGDVKIEGTVFGGGEANEAGSEVYDFSFISVTEGIDININGNSHEQFYIRGSVFGSGNASSTSGTSYIYLKNYGTVDEPQSNISLQRADLVTLDNSAVALSGASDRTNEYSSTYFSISRVDEVKLKNNSCLYMNFGANLLKKFTSVAEINGVEEKAAVTIDEETGANTKNVDNRIYMAEGKNLNIATNEQVTAYGEVSGMTFLGIFTNLTNPATSTGLYNKVYENGDYIDNAGTFVSNSYVLAQHLDNHDITVDGFYTNYSEEDYIKVGYVGVTPEDDVYYMWLVGEDMDVTTFEISLTASKYATLGTYELGLTGFAGSNLIFSLVGFSAGLKNGITLVDPQDIVAVEPDERKANSIYGLTMKTGNNGWQTNGLTEFLTQDGGIYTGTRTYNGDNSSYTPALNFCFYHSENLNIEQDLGTVKIRFQVLTPIDDLNYSISYIDINVTLNSALYQNDFYEAAITPGEQFGLFTTTETIITDESSLSTYFSLYMEDFSETDYYEDYNTYKHVLVSRDSNNLPCSFPENTKIVMMDNITNKYYYYIVTAQDIRTGKYEYELTDFLEMGSDDVYYNEVGATQVYYNSGQDLIYENFIFHVYFDKDSVNSNIVDNRILMELRDTDDQILLGVLGIQRDTMVYSVYKNKSSRINVTAELGKDMSYLGETINLNVISNFTQNIVDSKTIYDTKYFDQKMGIKISMFDIAGNQLNSDTLLGVNFVLNDQTYYPRIDGSVRIRTADKVSNVLSKIKINTKNNTTIATGDYTIRIESFGSPDGIYYGTTSSDTAEVHLTIINSAFGIKAYSSDECKIVNSETGYTINENNNCTMTVEYSSGLDYPNITMTLYRRKYDEVYSQEYEEVDLADYVKNDLMPSGRPNEYWFERRNPVSRLDIALLLKDNLTTGTYKLVFKLYDDESFIGEAYEYIIIK